MKTHLELLIFRRYWWIQLAFPVLCLLACLPCLLLALWSERATRSNNSMLNRLITHHITHKREIVRPEKNLTGEFLWHQFKRIEGSFKSEMRVDSVDWHSKVLIVRGEARSMLAFVSGWSNWSIQNKEQPIQLISYQLKGHPFFKVTVTNQGKGD